MAEGSIWEIKLFSLASGQECLNVFHYEQVSGGDYGGEAGQAVADAFWDDLDTALLNILHPDTTVLRVELVELDFPAINNTTPINLAGTFVDTDDVGPAPSFISAGVRYNRIAAGQRYGWKRFAGIPLAALEGNGYESTYASALATLASVIQTGFSAGEVQFVPFVAHRPILLGTNPTGYVPGSVSVASVGTQDTRKP